MSVCFFFNDTATTEIYTLSLHDALPISLGLRRRLARCRRAAGLALRQIDSKSSTAALVAGHRNGAVMITDHRLHDGEPEPRPLQFRRVIRRENPPAPFPSQALCRGRHLD